MVKKMTVADGNKHNPDKAFSVSITSMFFFPAAIIRKALGNVYVPLELEIIGAAKKALSKKDSSILEQQLSEINKVQRLHYKKDTKTTLFKFGFLVIWSRRKNLFSISYPCATLCKVKFKIDDLTTIASFIVLNNKITFIEYNNNIEAYLSRSDIQIVDVDTRIVPLDPHNW